MMEGMFGFIITSFYSFVENPFKEIIDYKLNIKNDIYSFILLIVDLLLYFILCGGKNAYRVLINKIYSPMTKSLTDYFLNPLLLVHYYYYDNEFTIDKEKNFFLFNINLILSIVIVFFGCVYNEILVLFCCGLERDTHRQVAIRAISDVSDIANLIEDDSDSDD